MTLIDHKNKEAFHNGASALRNNIDIVLNNPDQAKSSEAFSGTVTAPTLVSGRQLDHSKEMRSELGKVLDHSASNDITKTL